MSRVKKGLSALKSRRNILKQVKGYRFGRSTKKREALTAIAKAGESAFAHRRDKKNDMRSLWTVRLNAALRPHGISYSKFIGACKKANIELDRKVLSQIAADAPEAFEAIVAKVK